MMAQQLLSPGEDGMDEAGVDEGFPMDCPACGGEECVVRHHDYDFEDDLTGASMKVVADVCGECGEEDFPIETTAIILQRMEEVKGCNHIRYRVHKGGVVKYIVH